MICGGGRTGSTLLDLILGSNPKAFSCGEVNAWFRKYRSYHREIHCTCQDANCAVWNRLKYLKESEFHIKSFDLLQKDFIVDSSKDLHWVVDANNWAIKNDLRVINLLIFKEPIDYYFSFWKRGRSFNNWRKTFLHYYRNFLKTNIHFFSVNYTDLVEKEKATLNNISQLIGISCCDYQSSFKNFVPHILFGSSSVQKQISAKELFVKKGAFPDEFEKQIIHFKALISHNTEINKIYNHIKLRDVNTRILDNNPIFNNSIHKPLYYYYSRMKQIYDCYRSI